MVAKDTDVGVDKPHLEWDDVALHYIHHGLSVAAGLEVDEDDTQEIKTTAKRRSSSVIDWPEGDQLWESE